VRRQAEIREGESRAWFSGQPGSQGPESRRMQWRGEKEQGGPAQPTQKGAARDLTFFPVVACHLGVLEKFQTSAEMLALNGNQAKLAGIFPEAGKNRSPLSAAHGEPHKFSRNKTRKACGNGRMAGYFCE